MSATPPSVPAPRHISRSQLLFWGAVLLIGIAAGDRPAARRDVSSLEQHDSAGLRRPGRDVGRREAARARHPPHRPERRPALARGVSRPAGHRHVHRPVVPRLLPARGEASERGRAQLPGRLASGDRRGQRQRPRQRASVSPAGRGEVEARPAVALGRRNASRSCARLEAATTSACSRRRRRSPASRCIRSRTPRRRTSSTQPAISARSSSGRTAPTASRARYVRSPRPRSARRSSTATASAASAASTITSRS